MRCVISRFVKLLLPVGLLACGGSAAPAKAPASPGDHGHGDHAHGHHGHGAHGQHGQHAFSHPHAQHRFEDADRWSQVFDAPDRAAWQKPDEVVKLLAIAPGMVVADLGAGTGYFLARLSAAVGPTGKVLGLDVEAAMVEHMKGRAAKEGLGNVEARQVAPDDPGLPARGVDRVLVVNTWHHLGDRVAYAAKLREGLAPGGFVLVVDFTKQSQMGPPPEMRLTPEEVAADLRAGGLEAVILDGHPLAEQYVVLGRR